MIVGLLRVLRQELRLRVTRRILSLRVRARFRGMRADPTVVWDYGYRDLDAFEIGEGVNVLPFCEIVVYKHSAKSPIPGRLALGDFATLSTGANVRAAGGTISIGRHSTIAQHCILVAANHVIAPGALTLRTAWDTARTGVFVGENVWVAANCVLLPGTRIGDNSVIAAGSVVRGEVPPNEIWGGVPARHIRAVDQAR